MWRGLGVAVKSVLFHLEPVGGWDEVCADGSRSNLHACWNAISLRLRGSLASQGPGGGARDVIAQRAVWGAAIAMLSSQCVDCTPPCLHAEEVHTPPGHAQLRRVLHQLPVRLRPPLQHLGRHAATAPATARRCSHTRGRAGRTREVVRDAVGCAVHQSGAVRVGQTCSGKGHSKGVRINL